MKFLPEAIFIFEQFMFDNIIFNAVWFRNRKTQPLVFVVIALLLCESSLLPKANPQWVFSLI